MLVELGDKGFLSLPVSILVCAKDSPSSFNQCSPPGADLAWVDLEPASYLCCGLLTFECLKGYLSLKGGAVLLATLLHLLLLRAYFVILGAGTDLSYLSEILGPSQRSNVGQELDSGDGPREASSEVEDLRQPIHEAVEKLLITDRERRGILRDPIAPGTYNLNPIAYNPYLVPTSAVTIDWAAGERVRMGMPAPVAIEFAPDPEGRAAECFRFTQLRVTSMDGFHLEVDVRMIIRIRPEFAPFVIARFGSVENLIEQIVHPLVDASFRNRAGEEKAIAFVQGRYELQQQALSRAREEFQHYFVEAQNLLIELVS